MSVQKRNYYMFVRCFVRNCSLILILLLPQLSFAQQTFIQNEAQAELGTPALGPSVASVDSKGNLFTTAIDPDTGKTASVIPVSNSLGLGGNLQSINGYFNVGIDTIEAASTTTVLNLTSHAARVGDLIIPTGGTAGNIDVAIPVCSVAVNSVTLCYPLPATPSTDAITIRRPAPLFTPKEDSTLSSGDAGVLTFGWSQATQAALVDALNEAVPQAISRHGTSFTAPRYDGTVPSTETVVSREDDALGTVDAGIKVLAQSQDPLTVDQGTNGDAGFLKTDRAGRTITTLAPAGEMWQSCSAAITNTTPAALKTAVASNRHYITSITCTNTSAVASLVNIANGAGTTMVTGAVPSNTSGGIGVWNQTFPVPLRGDVNGAVNVAVLTTATSTICCASGYISVN